MDWGGANPRFLGLVSVGAAQSLDQTALRPSGIKRICHIDVKYITHVASHACVDVRKGIRSKNVAPRLFINTPGKGISRRESPTLWENGL